MLLFNIFLNYIPQNYVMMEIRNIAISSISNYGFKVRENIEKVLRYEEKFLIFTECYYGLAHMFNTRIYTHHQKLQLVLQTIKIYIARNRALVMQQLRNRMAPKNSPIYKQACNSLRHVYINKVSPSAARHKQLPRCIDRYGIQVYVYTYYT